MTTSFNQAHFLELTLRSVLSQEYPNLEYIVIDDGSTDESVLIIQKYASCLDYWETRANRGQADALLSGFARSTGDIMGWIGSDDLLLPGALMQVASYFFCHPEKDAVSCGAILIDDICQPHPRYRCKYTLGVGASYNRLRFYGQEGVYQQGVFWRRLAYNEVGGVDRKLHFIMDLDLFVKLARRRSFGRLPRLVACCRQHKSSKSCNWKHVHDAEFETLQRQLLGNLAQTRRARMVHQLYKWESSVRRTGLVLGEKLGLVKLERTIVAARILWAEYDVSKRAGAADDLPNQRRDTGV